MTQNEQIVQALNCVSHEDTFACFNGRIIRKQLQLYDSTEITPEKAIQILETRIKVKRIQLKQAEDILREIRELALADAEDALAEALGD